MSHESLTPDEMAALTGKESNGQGFAWDDLSRGSSGDAVTGYRNLDLLLDVPMQVSVELGRARRQIREVLSLAPGAVLELDKLAAEPVDVLVNGKLVARGEVVVIGENFGVRITDILSPAERAKLLK